MIGPLEHAARDARFAKVLQEELNRMNEAASTPAGGGEITPAASDRATSLACPSGEAEAVAPPKPDDLPAAAGADVKGKHYVGDIFRRAHFAHELKNPPFAVDRDDDSDEFAFPRSRRIICSASSDGQVTIHRFGETGIALTAAEARTVFQFLEDAQPIFERIAP